MRRSPSRGRPPGTKSKIPTTVRDAVTRRSGGKCEAAVIANCRRKGGHLHHKLMRSQGGKHTEGNLVDVCEPCHMYIHAHPNWAYENGWLVRSAV
jgi:5-methylcytosine-specific restriction endonuclease McrA